MSHRPINGKRARRMRRVLLRRPLPRYFDAVEWLQDRRHAQTAGGARALLEAGRLRTTGGNIVGREMLKYVEDDKDVVKYYATPVLPISIRKDLVVIPDA